MIIATGIDLIEIERIQARLVVDPFIDPALPDRQPGMDRRHMCRGRGRELRDQLFDPALLGDALDECGILEALVESPAESIDEKQHDSIIVL